jgi:hypothetical protein
MSVLSKTTKLSRAERERILKLKQKFETRISIAKLGKDSLAAGDYGGAIRRFVDYLTVVAEVRGVKDIYQLKTEMFDPKKDVTEMLMISHIFFEMARIYDVVPKFQGDSERCLGLFVDFSANQPFQVVNSEMIRKHLKKSYFKNPEPFKNAHRQIFVQSKKCFIVTFCYGDRHPVTAEYREFKAWLLNFSFGQSLVGWYYRHSPGLIKRFEHNLFFQLLATGIIRPCLFFFSKTLLRTIIRK